MPAIELSPLVTTVDTPTFLRLLKESLSLSFPVKRSIIYAMPTLCEFQVLSLMAVWENEKEQFKTLQEDHPEDIIKLKKRMTEDWAELERHFNLPATDDLNSQEENTMPMFGNAPLDFYDTDDEQPNNISEGDQLRKTLAQIKSRVLGQDSAVDQLATACFYHKTIRDREFTFSSRHRRSPRQWHAPAQPPILLTGTTGTGKTHIVKEICKSLGLVPVCIDASCLVRTGIVGQSVDDIGRTILDTYNKDVSLAEHAVIFLDEFDKLLGGHNSSDILPQLLTLLEGSSPVHIPTRHQDKPDDYPSTLATDRMLFILGGSFQCQREASSKHIGFTSAPSTVTSELNVHHLHKMGLPTELLGRIGQLIQLNPLTRELVKEIFFNSPTSPLERLKQQLKLFRCRVSIDDAFIERLLDKAEFHTFGARALFQVFENLPVLTRIRLAAVSDPGSNFVLTKDALENL